MIAQKRSTAEPNQKADLNRRWPQTGESENVTFPPQMGADARKMRREKEAGNEAIRRGGPAGVDTESKFPQTGD
jgi:hypothetical protein